MSADEKPSFAKDEHFQFLEELRESGETNMFGARPYLVEAFPDLSAKQSLEVLQYWMKV